MSVRDSSSGYASAQPDTSVNDQPLNDVEDIEFQKILLNNYSRAIEAFKQDIENGTRNVSTLNSPKNRASFSVVRGLDQSDGELGTVPNFLDISIDDTTKSFLDLPDSMRRSLVPVARVYKTFIDREGTQVDLRIKTDPNNNGTSRVELQSIDFTRQGGNPAEVDHNIEFNIKLSARELGFYIKRQYPLSEQGREDDFTRECETNGVAWIDLIKIDPGRSLEVDSELVINETNARIKVILGYAPPPLSSIPDGMHPDEFAYWSDSITSQSEIFFLNLKKHSLDFKESGEVGLSIDFRAAGGSGMLVPESDILFGPRMRRRMKDLAASLRIKKDIKRQATTALNSGNNFEALRDKVLDVLGEDIMDLTRLSPDLNACLETLASGIEIAIASHEGKIQALDDYSKNRLISQIDQTGGTSYGFQSFGSQFRAHKRVMYCNDPEENEIEYRFSTAPTQNRTSREYILFGDIIEAALELVAENGLLGENRDANDPADIEYSRYKTNTDNSSNIETNLSPEAHTTPFSKFLMDDSRRKETIKKYGSVFLSNLVFESLNRNGNIDIPLIYLPISFGNFKAWYENEVGLKTSFEFRDFMTSLFTSFLPNHVLGKNMYPEGDREGIEVPAFSVTSLVVDYTVLEEVINTVDGGYPFYRRGMALGGVITPDEYERIVKEPTTDEKMNSTGNLMIVQQVRISTTLTQANTPDLLWGQSTRGVLERVTFERDDIPFFAEARLFSDRSSTSNNMLREKYNTSLEMLGNTAFLPGSSLRLNPAPLDLGFTSDAETSVARSLGLGGLYSVNYAEHQLDLIKKSWTTKLATKWNSFGDGLAGENVNGDSDVVCLDRVVEGQQRLLNARRDGLEQRQRRQVDLRMDASLQVANLRARGVAEAQVELFESQLYEQIDADLREIGDEINALPADYIIPEESEEP